MATGVSPRKSVVKGEVSLAFDGRISHDELLELPVKKYVCSVGSGDSDGRLYFDDNIYVLRALLEDRAVRKQVRCVYIDPPYATRMSFVDRGVAHAYDDELAGAAYLEFMRRRLILLRELLADDGLIFVHIDQNMLFELKLLMDEVFGRARFLNLITRRKCNRKNYTRNAFGNVSDHILLYSKSAKYVWHRPYQAWSDEQISREYPCIDEATGRRFKKVPIHAPGVRKGETGKPWRGKLPPPGKHWQFVPERLEALDRNGEIYWSPNGNPRRKIFFEQSKGLPVQDLWLDFRDAHNQNIHITGYPTEKNYEMLELIVKAATNPGDLVLDCFCGSGTTLEAAARHGRRFIGIDNSPAARAATLKRLQHGRETMGDFVGVRGKRKSANLFLPFSGERELTFAAYEPAQLARRVG